MKTKTTLLLVSLLLSIIIAYITPTPVYAALETHTWYPTTVSTTVYGVSGYLLNRDSSVGADDPDWLSISYKNPVGVWAYVYILKPDGTLIDYSGGWIGGEFSDTRVYTFTWDAPAIDIDPEDKLLIKWRLTKYGGEVVKTTIAELFHADSLPATTWTFYFDVVYGSVCHLRVGPSYQTRVEFQYNPLVKVTINLNAETTQLQSDDYFIATYDYNGGTATQNLVTGENIVYLDEGGQLSIAETSYKSTSTQRWIIPGGYSQTFSTDSAVTLTYYGQYYVTWRVETTSGPALNSTNYVSGYCYQNGSQIARSPLYDGHDLSGWCDAGENIWVDEQSTLSEPGRKWIPTNSPQTVTASGTYTFYFQYVYADLYYVNVTVTKGDPNFISTDSSNYFNLYWKDRWLSLDGDDYLETPYNPAFDLNVFTVEIWFKSTYTGTSTFHPIISKKYALYDASTPWPSTLSTWSYRKKITIQENAGQDLTDYQIKLVIHYGSGTDSGSDIYLNEKCKSDFGDIRFADADSNLLPYWMEEKVDSDYAVFWVKVPSIPANGTADIYIYYGNPDATYAGDGEQVFEFFDDFEDGVLDTNKWALASDYPSGASVTEHDGMLDIYLRRYPYSVQDFPDPIAIEMKVKKDADVAYWVGVTRFDGNANPDDYYNPYNGIAYVMHDSSHASQLRRYVDGSKTVLYDSGTIDWPEDTWMRVTFKDGKDQYDSYYYVDGTLYAQTSDSTTYTANRVSPGAASTSASHLYVEWFAVRKYVDPEPSISAIGGEEQNAFRGWGVGWVDSNVLGAFVEDGDERNVVQLSAGEGLDGAIHQLVVVFASDSIRVYLDGEFKASTTRTVSDVTGEAPLRIGYDGVNYGVFDITELRFYNRTLSADEIASNNHRDLEPIQNGLIIWYEFTNVSNQVIDVTWNGHDAEIHGDPQQLTETVTKIVYEGVSLQVWQKGGDVISTDATSTGSNENEIWDILENEWTVDSPSHVFYYWDHLRVSLQIQLSKPYSRELSEANYAVVTATSYGNNFTYAVWPNGTDIKIWVDRGGNVYWSATTSASTSNHRWATPGAITLEGVDQPAISSATYYEQLKVTWHLEKAHQNFTDTDASNYFNATGQQFNGTLTLTGLYIGRDLAEWVDYNSTIAISRYSSGSNSTHRWISCGESYQVSSAGMFTFKYREEILTALSVVDAEGYALPEDSITQLYLKMFNGSARIIQLNAPIWLEAHVKHDVVKVYWRKLWTLENVRSIYFYVSGNETEIEVPMIWGDVGGSGMEVYIESSEGGVYAPIWDGMQQVLMISVDQKAPGQLYLYYGPLGSSPRYVLVDNVKLSDYAWEVDSAKQLVRVRLGYSTYIFDFSGKTQPSQVETSSLLQQLLATIQQLRAQYVNITPTVRVQRFNVSLILAPMVKFYKFVAEWVDAHLPISHAILFPAIFVAVTFFGIASILSKFGGGKAETTGREPTAPPSRGFITKSRWLLFTVLQSIAFTAVIFYFAPTLFPQQFQRPPIPFQILLAAAALASLFAAFVVLAITWREER